MAEQRGVERAMAGARRTFSKAVAFGIAPTALSAADWERLEERCGELVRVGPRGSIERSGADADALLVDIGRPLGPAAFAAAPRLRYVGVFGTGHAGVDTRAAARRGVTVTNVPGYATQSVAEFTVAAVLQALRPSAPQPPPRGRELRGRRVGVVGLGRIGTAVATIARAGFGAEVRYWSRSPKSGVPFARMGLDRLLSTSEVVTLSIEENRQTVGLIGPEQVALLPPGAVLVNFASAAIVDQTALLRRLQRGDLRLAIDHADEVPQRVLRRLRGLPNVRIYPPVGFETEEAAAARAEVFLGNIDSFLRGRPVNVVSPPGRAR
jgi:phosphoglycerate dehydrogenase-like enzyme